MSTQNIPFNNSQLAPQMPIQPVNRSRRAQQGSCPCCRRQQALTFHHLIPKKLHRRARFKQTFTRQHLSLGVYLCRPCHSGIHDLYSEMVLAKDFADIESLLCDDGLRRHFDWVSKQKAQTHR
jgi:hypothetical protein